MEQRTIILTVLQYALTISKKCGGKDKVLLLQYPVPNYRLYNPVFYLYSQQCFVEQSGKIIQSILHSHYFRSVESSEMVSGLIENLQFYNRLGTVEAALVSYFCAYLCCKAIKTTIKRETKKRNEIMICIVAIPGTHFCGR